jgi:hypothetical protein
VLPISFPSFNFIPVLLFFFLSSQPASHLFYFLLGAARAVWCRKGAAARWCGAAWQQRVRRGGTAADCVDSSTGSRTEDFSVVVMVLDSALEARRRHGLAGRGLGSGAVDWRAVSGQ